MKALIWRLPLFILLILSLGLVFVPQAQAASLTNVKDTITTSRPSVATYLTGSQVSNATQATVSAAINSNTIFLASDSAKFMPGASEALNTVTVASMSAANTPGTNQRIVYFTSPITGGHVAGGAVVVPITAMHTVQFTTVNPIPSSGKIVITFPGTVDTTASPSATTFALNGLTTAIASANISYKLDGSATCTFAVATANAPTITCTTSAAVAAATTITFLIGCADSSSNETTCTTQSPRLINPIKTADAGTADTWKITVKTQDASSLDIDTAQMKIGTIDAVRVQAAVDATFSFVISAPVTNGLAINTSNTTGCTNTETANAGFDPTVTSVDLGSIANTPTGSTKIGNIAAQLITISTNGVGGYSLTATSSGQLINPATGVFFASNTTPAAFPSGSDWFGIHPCGLDVTSATWTEAGTDQNCDTKISGQSADECKYAWPTAATAVTLASDSTGPIGESIATGNGLTTVEYAAGADAAIPAGIYTTYITYVATPTF